MDLKLHDIVEMKKEHPCGSHRWEVLRVGMDLKLRCCGCGHEVMSPGQGRKEHPADHPGRRDCLSAGKESRWKTGGRQRRTVNYV